MSEWKECKLGEVAERITKGTTPTTLGLNFTDDGINFIKSESFGYDGRIDKTKIVFIDEQTHARLLRSQLRKDDILFSMAGVYLGKTALVTDDILPANTNQAVGIIRLIRNKALAQYVRYYLSQEPIIELINNFSGQSAQPNINLEEIGSIPILLRPLPEQHAIASVLSSLDDKIDLLHRQNKTLERMAEVIYRHCFIDNREDAWQGCDISDLASHKKKSINPSKNPETEYYHYSIPAFDQKHMPICEFGLAIRSNKYEVTENTILFSKLNPHKDKRIWLILGSVTGNSVCSTEFQVMKPRTDKYLFFLYGFISYPENYDEIAAGVGGTSGSHQRIDPEVIFNYKCFKPSDDALNNYNNKVEPLYSKIHRNLKSIRTLEYQRDIILPKLMSGEVMVKS